MRVRETPPKTRSDRETGNDRERQGTTGATERRRIKKDRGQFKKKKKQLWGELMKNQMIKRWMNVKGKCN